MYHVGEVSSANLSPVETWKPKFAPSDLKRMDQIIHNQDTGTLPKHARVACSMFARNPLLYPLPLNIPPNRAGFWIEPAKGVAAGHASDGELFLPVAMEGRTPLSLLTLFLEPGQLDLTSMSVTARSFSSVDLHQCNMQGSCFDSF
jgi:hypothetical protein